MSRKTERIYSTAPFDGEDRYHAAFSFAIAFVNLEAEGRRQGREVLFDTLEVSIEREVVDDITIGSVSTVSYPVITVSAEAVRR